ncbi:cobalt transporter CbiM [Zavarzinia aquatilis]|uniref:Cobalt transporter CbiM n=1 Tax=Zavarzinia aquatilis TaxID=2211142 RepID=A0A317E8I9_9PROT|nr:cobalt transporter CbiM [Zavarzinia aquatilis]PWR22862.1 cobalt transporter CbiM [Zavarzinia aquatilis]
MAHIPDGVLSLPVGVAGWAGAAALTGFALRSLKEEAIPGTAILAAVFFTVSLVAVPVGPSSVHLLLSGLMGLMIGPLTAPAVLVGLVLQALLFGFGGVTSLGVNLVNIALPGILAGLVLAGPVARATPGRAGVIAGIGAGLCVAATGGGVALALALSSSDFVPSARIMLVTYLPLMAAEALITGFSVGFLKRVKPEALAGARP